MNRIVIPLLCALLPATMATASEAVRNVPSSIPGAPDHQVPMSASQLADERMRDIIASKLAETLDMGGSDDLDMQRLLELARAAEDSAAGDGDASRIADAAYDRLKLMDKAAYLDFVVAIIRRSEQQQGFAVQPRRWVVERTFGWLTRYRRLVRDYEARIDVSEAMIYAAMASLIVRRIKH